MCLIHECGLWRLKLEKFIMFHYYGSDVIIDLWTCCTKHFSWFDLVNAVWNVPSFTIVLILFVGLGGRLLML